MTKQIKFSSKQVSDFAMTMEKHGIEIDFWSDAQASAMFGELLIEMARSLDSEQADIYHQAI